MRATAMLLIALVSGCLSASKLECWSKRITKRDLILEGAFVVATVTDWIQTRPVVNHCDETNPILGACGNRVPPAVFFPLAMAAHAGVAAVLPDGWREAWQGTGIGVEVNQAWTTYELGWRP